MQFVFPSEGAAKRQTEGQQNHTFRHWFHVYFFKGLKVFISHHLTRIITFIDVGRVSV